MGIKVGALIKDARTAAKLSQTKLADLVGVSASDISKAEKGEKELTQAVLKKIATETGVTQKSLIDAAKEDAEAAAKKSAKKTAAAKKTTEKKATEKKTAEKKTAEKKTATAKKTAEKKTAAKKTAEKKTAGTKVELSAAEKKLVELYRDADSKAKKGAVSVLKGESTAISSSILSRIMESGLLKNLLG